MSITQAVSDGKIVDTSASAASVSKSKKTTGSDMDKMDFLNLLVAEMQYQDPLEPSKNTDYVAQLATFTQVESLETVADSVKSQQASELVGKYVILNVTNKVTGNTTTVSGICDYVTYENGETYLAVEDKLYSIDDLDSVVNADYANAATIADAFKNIVAQLPSLANLTNSDAKAVLSARAVYENLTDYQKSFVDASALKKLVALEEQLKEWGAFTENEESDETNTTEG